MSPFLPFAICCVGGTVSSFHSSSLIAIYKEPSVRQKGHESTSVANKGSGFLKINTASGGTHCGPHRGYDRQVGSETADVDSLSQCHAMLISLYRHTVEVKVGCKFFQMLPMHCVNTRTVCHLRTIWYWGILLASPLAVSLFRRYTFNIFYTRFIYVEDWLP